MRQIVPALLIVVAACGGESKPPAVDPNHPPEKPTVTTVQSLKQETVVTVLTAENISSGADKIGGTFSALVSGDVKDERGDVVVPSGSRVTLRIVEIMGRTTVTPTGKLRLEPVSVTVQQQEFPIKGTIGEVASIIASDMLIVERSTPIAITLTAPLQTKIAR
jgi:hypothetical protein